MGGRLALGGCLAVIMVSAVCSGPGPVTPGGQLVLCGQDELFILDVTKSPPAKVWSWKAANRPELPDAMRSKFRTIDESKPVDGGSRILITASSDGVALIDVKTGKAVFYATAANAHSAELLPGGRVVVAASHSPQGDGDRLILFDLSQPDQALFHTELSWAHGVVWDSQRQLLWALSDRELRGYKLAGWTTAAPSLVKAVVHDLPDSSGHDLFDVAGTAMLTLTTGRRCWMFDRDRGTFSPHPELADRPGVKCISVNPATQQTVWVQSEGGKWWTSKLRFLHPKAILELPGERLYKARWLPSAEPKSVQIRVR